MLELYQPLVLALLVGLVGLIAWGRIGRHWVSLGILLILLVTGAVSPMEMFSYIDWDVLGLILGMSVLTVFLEESGLMELVARFLEKRLSNPWRLVFGLSLMAGIVSIALENVTVVLLFAPITLRLAIRMGLNPIPVLIGVALASNMSGSATMIGDPPAILTAGYFNLAFMDFIWYDWRPSMFFLTLIPMIIACTVLAFVVVHETKNYDRIEDSGSIPETFSYDKVFLVEAVIFLSIKIVLLSLRHVLGIPLSLAAAVGVGGLMITRILHRDKLSVKKALIDGFEWRLLLFLAGVFVLSGAFAKHGLAKIVADAILSVSSNNMFLTTSLLVWISVLVSAVIDNVPYTATMLPVVAIIAQNLGVEPIAIAWALLLGLTLGGNLTYIGASANVTAVRILERKGYHVSFKDFIRISLPFNTLSVVTGWILYEVLWVYL